MKSCSVFGTPVMFISSFPSFQRSDSALHRLFLATMESLPDELLRKRPRSLSSFATDSRRVRFCPSPTADEEKKERKKKANRDRQRRFRDRRREHRYSETLCQNTNDFGDSSPASSTYIPAHQMDAITQFWARLRSIEKNPQTCCVCKECYHGIRMKGTQCERCSNEVRFILLNNGRTFLSHCVEWYSGTATGSYLITMRILNTSLKCFKTLYMTSRRWKRCFAVLRRRLF